MKQLYLHRIQAVLGCYTCEPQLEGQSLLTAVGSTLIRTLHDHITSDLETTLSSSPPQPALGGML